MAWKKIHNKYPALCSRCRGKLDRGAVVWYDRHAGRGAKIRCLACGAGVDVPVHPAPVPAPAEVEVELVRVPTPAPAPAPVVTEVRPDDAGLAAAIAAAIGPLVKGAVDEAAVAVGVDARAGRPWPGVLVLASGSGVAVGRAVLLEGRRRAGLYRVLVGAGRLLLRRGPTGGGPGSGRPGFQSGPAGRGIVCGQQISG
jgi:hypothetical protein